MNNREAFEAWMKKEMPHEPLQIIADSGVYLGGYAQTLWVGYQAGLAAQAQRIADLVKAYDQKLLNAERVLQESNSTWHRLLTLEEARVKELEQAAFINQEYVTEMQSQAQQPANVWQQAIDDELIIAHLGIAQNEVTREEAKVELNKLIAWHIDVAKYFESQAQQTESNLWRIERDYDMGKVYDSSGKFIAMTYGKDAQKFVDAHNAICVSQSPAPEYQEPAKDDQC